MLTRYRRLTQVTIAALATALLIAGCGGQQAAPKQEAAKPASIQITYVKSPLNVPSIVEKRQQLFEQEFGKDQISVQFPEINSGAKQTEALASGQLDFCNALGGTSAIMAAANGVDLKILNIYSRAPKAFTIMVKDPAITTAAQLKGKKVAGPKGTVLHQILLAALAKEQLPADSVEFISMDIPSGVSALANGSVDAALVAGPDVLRATKAGARILLTGEGLVDGIIVTAVRGGFLKEQPQLVERFRNVHKQSLAFMQQQADESLKLTAEETGLTPEDVKAMYGWYDFDPTIRPADIEDLKKTQAFLLERGMLTKTVDIESLLVR